MLFMTEMNCLNQNQVADGVGGWSQRPEKLEIINNRHSDKPCDGGKNLFDFTGAKTQMATVCAPQHPETPEHPVRMQTGNI